MKSLVRDADTLGATRGITKASLPDFFPLMQALPRTIF